MKLRNRAGDPYLVAMAKRLSKAEGAAEGAAPPNYWDYIRVEELLALQTGLARE